MANWEIIQVALGEWEVVPEWLNRPFYRTAASNVLARRQAAQPPSPQGNPQGGSLNAQ